ncbi:hypothetical protein BH09BAC3_BH09BAC3_00350 [soil metagenome]
MKSVSIRISGAVSLGLRLMLFFSISASSQGIPGSEIRSSETVPTKLLSSRSVVLYTHSISEKDLVEAQSAFQQIGIDAIAFFETDIVLAGKDITKAYAEYFINRQITYLLFLEKLATGYQITGVTFDQMPTLYDAKLPAWRLQKGRLNELLRTIFQDSWRSQKKQNYLVNEYPETDIIIDPFKGNRKEFYAIDLKVDNLAVPKFGNEAMDKELEEFFKTNYPLKYQITEAGVAEPDLRKQGFNYVLCYVHTTGKAAKEILGYDMTKVETAYASITFPSGQLQLKAIPAETEVYKFYFRHIDNGNVFFGTKWDSDLTWLDALRNHILGFKAEAKIN